MTTSSYAALLAAIFCSACQSETQRLEGDARDALQEVTIDPTSFLLRSLRRSTENPVDGNICGEINGKNRLGAYAGFRHFVITYKPKQVYLEDDPMFKSVYIRSCSTVAERNAYYEELAAQKQRRAVQDEQASQEAKDKARRTAEFNKRQALIRLEEERACRKTVADLHRNFRSQNLGAELTNPDDICGA